MTTPKFLAVFNKIMSSLVVFRNFFSLFGFEPTRISSRMTVTSLQSTRPVMKSKIFVESISNASLISSLFAWISFSSLDLL